MPKDFTAYSLVLMTFGLKQGNFSRLSFWSILRKFWSVVMIKRSETKFVALILVGSLIRAIYCLADFYCLTLDFSSSKIG